MHAAKIARVAKTVTKVPSEEYVIYPYDLRQVLQLHPPRQPQGGGRGRVGRVSNIYQRTVCC